MSVLTVYPENLPQHGKRYDDFAAIRQQLNNVGVQFERWVAKCRLAADADQSTVLVAYADAIARLIRAYDFQAVDVFKINPDDPEKATCRQKFLDEHTHNDFEVRFFVEGRGLFYLHVEHKVYALLCEKGDLITIPANTTHWFDMGENPQFTCIRLFTSPEGWLADFTGSGIGKVFPTFDQYVAGLS